jgi:hypothetical protein
MEALRGAKFIDKSGEIKVIQLTGMHSRPEFSVAGRFCLKLFALNGCGNQPEGLVNGLYRIGIGKRVREGVGMGVV